MILDDDPVGAVDCRAASPGERTWRLLGSSAPGRSHLRRGVGCEDAFAWRTTGRLTVAAIADGAGSRSPMSALGSYTAVRSVTAAVDDTRFRDAFGRGGAAALRWLFEHAFLALSAEAGLHGLDVDTLATTLAVAVLDDDRLWVGQVGDGVVVVRHGGGIEAVAVGRRGEHAGETDFVTEPDAVADHLAVYEGDGVDAFALSTDGLEYQITDVRQRTPFDQFFVDTWSYAARAGASSEAIGTFLERVDDQTGDDKTLVVAVRGFDGPPGEPCRASAAPVLRPRPADGPTEQEETAAVGAPAPQDGVWPEHEAAPAGDAADADTPGAA